MKRTMRWVGVGLLLSLGVGVAGVQAQQPVAAEPQVPSRTVQAPREVAPPLPVPRLVKFASTLKDELGKSRTGVVGLTFAIYKEPEGGAPLWLETQNVELDEQGRYTVLLGATRNEGLPLELFTSGESRWLAVQVNLPGESEQPRVLLVSVPYALKAADADTVGGMSASAFVLAAPSGTTSGTGTATQTTASSKTGAKTTTSGKTAVAPAIGGGGTPNVVTKFDGTGANVINSSISDNGSRITAAEGIDFGSDFSFVGNANPAATGRVQMFDRAFVGFVVRGLNVLFETLQGSPAVPTEVMRVTQSGSVGIGTTTPAAKLHAQNGASAFTSDILSADGLAGECNSSGCAAVDAITSAPNGVGVFAEADVGTSVQASTSTGNAVLAVVTGACTGSTSACNLFVGQTGPNGARVNQVRVDGTGKGFFNGGTQTGGADFAESVGVRGEHSQYEPGDVLVIDRAAGRRLMLSRRAYSTRVAGIYSTKPGVLATTHSIDESDALAEEIPLAIVGIVPCKVTAENGSIAPGDLLVTSSMTGYAMKGTNRTRMLGAVVGKALEPLREGKGVIQVLVTLQ